MPHKPVNLPSPSEIRINLKVEERSLEDATAGIPAKNRTEPTQSEHLFKDEIKNRYLNPTHEHIQHKLNSFAEFRASINIDGPFRDLSYYGNEIDRKLDDYFSSLKESVQEVASTYFKLGRDV
jgi:hypothetical protein